MQRLDGKCILITGGSSGIGLATARMCYQLGATVVLVARDQEKLLAAKNGLAPEDDRVFTHACDLSNASRTQEMARWVIAHVGVPDVIVNSAGAGEWLRMDESTMEHYSETIASPYLAAAHTCKAFHSAMLKAGKGHFLLINSVATFFAFSGATGYLPSRWALRGLYHAFRADLAHTPLRVSTVIFGKVDSPYFTNNPISETRIPRLEGWLMPTLSATQAAEYVLRMMRSQAGARVYPRRLRIVVWFNRLFPKFFTWLLRRTGSRDIRL